MNLRPVRFGARRKCCHQVSTRQGQNKPGQRPVCFLSRIPPRVPPSHSVPKKGLKFSPPPADNSVGKCAPWPPPRAPLQVIGRMIRQDERGSSREGLAGANKGSSFRPHLPINGVGKCAPRPPTARPTLRLSVVSCVRMKKSKPERSRGWRRRAVQTLGSVSAFCRLRIRIIIITPSPFGTADSKRQESAPAPGLRARDTGTIKN